MAGRPPKDNSRDKQYRVRINDEEDKMLAFCSQETGEAKSEIFRKALRAYYENTKCVKTVLKDRSGVDEDYSEDCDFEDYGLDHISLQRSIKCPYCGEENIIDFEDYSSSSSEERRMGPQITYEFDADDLECCSCGKCFRAYGSIWEYPLGAYNYEDINVEGNEEK